MQKKDFFLADLMKILPSVNIPSFQKWVSMGLIEAAFDPGSPAGKRTYSRANLHEAFFVSELAAYGLSTSRIKAWMDQKAPWESTSQLRERLHSLNCSGFFRSGRGPVGGKDRTFVRKNPGLDWYVGDDAKALQPGNTFSYVVVDLGEIKREIDRRLEEEGWL